nr:MAG TPA: hypothetical protein [Caudoviricetes sp.]
MDDGYIYSYDILVLDKSTNTGGQIKFKSATFQNAMECLKLKYEAEINSDYSTCDVMIITRNIFNEEN